jgi:hypothetical protein
MSAFTYRPTSAAETPEWKALDAARTSGLQMVEEDLADVADAASMVRLRTDDVVPVQVAQGARRLACTCGTHVIVHPSSGRENWPYTASSSI